jgi:glycosyltransferase involved in cell wall biosynthesis
MSNSPVDSKAQDILILNYEYPPLGGGAGQVSREYAEGLTALGHRVTVVTAWYPGESEYSPSDGLTIIRLKSLRRKTYQSNPVEMLSWAWHARRFLMNHCREHAFDACIAFFSVPGGIVARSLRARFGIPYIISTHGADIPGFYPAKMRKYHLLTGWYIRRVWQEASRVLFLTSTMRELGETFAPELADRYAVLPNGGDTRFFSPDPSVRAEIFTVLFAGRLCEEKDPFVFLRAIEELVRRGVAFEARIIGDGPLRADMESFVRRHGLSDRVRFLGWLDRTTLLAEYRRAHVQAACSRVEAMSVGVLESLLSGLYVLATPVSGNPDMITPGVNGDFVEVGDYRALADKLHAIALSPGYSPAHADAPDRLARLRLAYSWQDIVRRLNDTIS